MSVVAIIQARTGSTRLPGKVLLRLEDKTVLEHVILRVEQSKRVDRVVVATTDSIVDIKIAELCKSLGVDCFCGSENDVLDRFYKAAKRFSADHIVRITADCPLMDHEIIDQVVGEHLLKQADYTSNTIKVTFPDGEDVEVFTFEALEKAWQEAKLVSEREHVTPFIRGRSDIFTFQSVENDVDLSSKRWTLDDPEDLEFARKIYETLYPQDNLFGLRKILDLLEEYPELEQINSHIGRNEGYKKSLREDKLYG